MREHGWHQWTARNGQVFWCKCDLAKDHRKEPVWHENHPSEE